MMRLRLTERRKIAVDCRIAQDGQSPCAPSESEERPRAQFSEEALPHSRAETIERLEIRPRDRSAPATSWRPDAAGGVGAGHLAQRRLAGPHGEPAVPALRILWQTAPRRSSRFPDSLPWDQTGNSIGSSSDQKWRRSSIEDRRRDFSPRMRPIVSWRTCSTSG